MTINEYTLLNQRHCQSIALAEEKRLNELKNKLISLYKSNVFKDGDKVFIREVIVGNVKRCSCLTKARIDICLERAGITL